jgi:hypothetical protein
MKEAILDLIGLTIITALMLALFFILPVALT